MQFLKKHYEKIILSAVLLGLGATAVWFYGAVKEANSQALPVANEKAHRLTPLDLTAQKAALSNISKPPPLELTGPHNLFNPVTWKMGRDGVLYHVILEGPAALQVTNISPLYYMITYDRPGLGSFKFTTTTAAGRYTTGFSRVGEKDPTKNYILTGTNVAADGSLIMSLKILDNGEDVTVTTAKPYKRVDGYQADLLYPPDTAVFTNKHVNDPLTLSGEPYKIIAITNNAVTVQNTRNTQQTTIQWSGGQ
jgi:hypothetical protein